MATIVNMSILLRIVSRAGQFNDSLKYGPNERDVDVCSAVLRYYSGEGSCLLKINATHFTMLQVLIICVKEL
jgi:hypothetical protein